MNSKLMPYEIAPITTSSVVIPDTNLAILNYDDTSDQLRPDNTDAEENFCMRYVKLSLAINTVNDFNATNMSAARIEDNNNRQRATIFSLDWPNGWTTLPNHWMPYGHPNATTSCLSCEHSNLYAWKEIKQWFKNSVFIFLLLTRSAISGLPQMLNKIVVPFVIETIPIVTHGPWYVRR